MVEVIEEQAVSPNHIEDIYEFANKISASPEAADQDFHHKRAIVDALDIRACLTAALKIQRTVFPSRVASVDIRKTQASASRRTKHGSKM